LDLISKAEERYLKCCFHGEKEILISDDDPSISIYRVEEMKLKLKLKLKRKKSIKSLHSDGDQVRRYQTNPVERELVGWKETFMFMSTPPKKKHFSGIRK
jgi:hypothetical protein